MEVSGIKDALIAENISTRKEVPFNNTQNEQQLKVGIIDYGAGNLYSLENSLNKIGVESKIVSVPEQYAEFDKLLLPGVGAFEPAMTKLRDTGHFEAILEHVHKGRALMGICLGAQLLLSESEEFGRNSGLGLIEGSSQRIEGSSNPIFTVPHVGWSQTEVKTTGPLTQSLPNQFDTYFIHSFKMIPKNEDHLMRPLLAKEESLVASSIQRRVENKVFKYSEISVNTFNKTAPLALNCHFSFSL